MFSYLNEKAHGLMISLGRYMKKELDWVTADNELMDCDDVNRLDRQAIALDFYEVWTLKGNSLPNPADEELFLTELAIKIDALIPKHYFEAGVACGKIKKDYEFQPEPKYYKRHQSRYTMLLEFVYEQNEWNERRQPNYHPRYTSPSGKQLDYLISLLKANNLKLRADKKITKEACQLFINYFLGHIPLDWWINSQMATYLRPKYKQHDYYPIIKALDTFLDEEAENEFDIKIDLEVLEKLKEYDWIHEYRELLDELQMLNLKHCKRLNKNAPIFYTDYLEIKDYDEPESYLIAYLFSEFGLIDFATCVHSVFTEHPNPPKDFIVISEKTEGEIKDFKDALYLDFSPLFA